MKTVISHPTGNQNARAAVLGMYDAGLLGEFYTTIATFEGSWLDKLSGFPPFGELRRRTFDTQLANSTTMWPLMEACRLLSSKAGIRHLTRHEKGVFCIDAVFRNLDKRVGSRLQKTAHKEYSGVYAYEDGAAFSFQVAKQSGIKCLYDLPIGYWRSARKLLEAERERWPGWIPTLTGFNDSPAKLARKDQELAMADRIFVASRFTAKTLEDYPGKLAGIDIIPYGFPAVSGEKSYPSFSNSRPMKLLFVGGLSQRKGLADLLAAVKLIGHHVELTIVGRKASNDPCPALDEGLKNHTWIPSLSHEGILKVMREHDVFVFPSLFEGFGLVITEAMSQGTPVITTDRTCGPDLIAHGQNGWLTAAGSVEALEATIGTLLSRPEKIAENGKNAMETARKRPWSQYGTELAEAVGRALQ